MFGNRFHDTETDHPGIIPATITRATTAGIVIATARAAAASAAARSAALVRASVPGGPRGRGRKARRGDIRTAALLLLNEEPRNGYQIMQEVQERSDGVWRPSPGSTYPALQQLEDEGLIRARELDGRKLFELTDAGREYVKERGEDKPAPWEQMSGDVSDQAHELGRLIREVASAFTQVVKTGSEAQMGEARKVLTTTRKDLYRILADGDPGEGDSEAGIVGEDA